MIKWIFETSVFQNGDVLYDAVIKRKDDIFIWDDNWWKTNEWENIKSPCIFHGSLLNADKLNKEKTLYPGAICSTELFNCNNWYSRCEDVLLNKNWIKITINEFLAKKDSVLDQLAITTELFFARPNSPLKQFSGRVISRNEVSYESFDYGFYHEDKHLEIIITPIKKIDNEWRFVVIGNKIATGSGYDAATHKALHGIEMRKDVVSLAENIANRKIIHDIAYIMDICESSGKYFLVEFNPFSGSDFYMCDGNKIYEALQDVC